jgi:DNA-binding LacI/PurR family transcriptional regulator
MQVEGVVIFSGLLSRRSPVLRTLEDAGIPVIMVDPHTPSFRETVWIDRAAAIRKVAQHLVQLGHRRFAALGIHPTSYYGTVRSQALQEYLAPPHAPADTQLLYLYEPEAQRMDFEYGRRLAERLLALPEPPAALISLSDRIAFGAMEYLKRNNFRIPEDFSITGYDNSELSAVALPPLTTVDPHVDRLIDQAVTLLLEKIEKKKPESRQSQRIEPDLVLRSSTGAPPELPIRTTALETG